MSKLTRLEVENYKRIECIDVRFGPHITEISGANGAGKSSTLDSLANLIVGQSQAPEKPIRTGASKARIKGTFGDLEVERTFTVDKYGETTRRLRISRGKEAYQSTEAQLRALIGQHMIDPGEFIRLDAKKKFEAMQIFVPEVDFKKLAREHKADYDRRTDVNRIAEEARAAANVIAVPSGTPDEEIDVSAGLKTLTEASDHNAGIQRVQALQDSRGRELRMMMSDAERLMQEAKRLQEEAQEREDKASQLVKDAKRVQAKIEETAAQIPTPIDLEAIRQELAAAQSINANVRKKLERENHLNRAKTYEIESVQLTNRINERQAAKQKVISEAKIPVPGLTFGDEEVFLNGEPFEQASTAEKMTVAVALACMRNPELRLLWVRDASLLDDKHYAHLLELSKQFDCQILLETVRSIGEDVIVLEDGKVKEASQESLLDASDDPFKVNPGE